MSLVNKIRSLSKTEKIVISSIAAVVVIAIVAGIIFFVNSKYLATTMRLLRVEGTVNIEDSSGSSKPVIDNIRFQSGDALNTGSDGLASVGLDDTKIVTLENDSRAEFYKSNKQLELKLTKGALFFEVTEKLADDETYEIKTSNMSVGIRGTSGYVYYDENGLESLIITDGVVKVSAYNPETGETKTVEVRGGEKITCYLYSDKTEDHDTIEFELTKLSEEDLPYFPLKMLIENEHLLDKVCEYTGWDKEKLRALFESFFDPKEPTPTPDEEETITETPTLTPTDKPIPTVTLTPTPSITAAPSASASPSAAPGATTTPASTPSSGSQTVPTVTSTPKPTTTTTPSGNTYTVTFVTNGKCTAPAAQTVSSGSKATKPADPVADGYTFGGWYKDSACTNSYNFNMVVTSNITLYAKWTAASSTPSTTPKPTKAPLEPPSELPGDRFVWLVEDEDNDIYIAYYYWGYGTTYMVYADNETGWVEAQLVYDSYGDNDLAWFESPETGVYYSFVAPSSAPEGYYMYSFNPFKYYAYKYDSATGETLYQLYVAGKGWVKGFREDCDDESPYYYIYYYYDDSGNRVDYYSY